MTTLVTGGAGFVGRRLVDALRARGERVRVLDLSPADAFADEAIVGSVADPAAAAAATDGVGTVFHLAGNAQLWARDPSVFEAVNHRGTAVMVAAARAADVRRFVHCSSLTTLVGQRTPVGPSTAGESTFIPPGETLGAYPRSKRLGELAVAAAVQDGLDAVIAIPTEPLGPGDAGLTPPTRMLLDFVNGRTPAYIDCLLNFVPVDSLADGLIATRDKGRRGERYLLSGENISLRRLLTLVTRLTGRPTPKTQLPYWVALVAGAVDTGLVASVTGRPPKAPLTGVRLAGRRTAFFANKAEAELSWRAGPLLPALRETLAWFGAEGLILNAE